MGHKWKIKVVKKVDRKDNYGECDADKKVIKIKKDIPSHTLFEETFFHEIIHAALEETEYRELSLDEKFVERMGKAVHQIFKTAEYEKPKDNDIV